MVGKKNPSPQPQILRQFKTWVLISKPPGMDSQPGSDSAPDLFHWAQEHFQQDYIGIVHRLDRNTSGLMVLALTPSSANFLSQSLKEGKFCRRYIAFTQGHIDQTKKWIHFLQKNPNTHHVTAFPRPSPGSQEAILTVTPIELRTWNSHPITLAQFELETGRTHQIRVQSAFEGHPLMGDLRYGKKKLAPALSQFPRVALHSHEIQLVDPENKQIVHLVDPLPADMAQVRSDSSLVRSMTPLDGL